jgi:hypothetical protein
MKNTIKELIEKYFDKEFSKVEKSTMSWKQIIIKDKKGNIWIFNSLWTYNIYNLDSLISRWDYLN